MTDVDPATWSPQAWKWFVYGYERGVRSGTTIGYADGHTDGAFAEAARKGPIQQQPDAISAALDMVAAQKAARRADALPVALTAEQIRAQAAASWAQVEHAIRGAA